MPPYDSCYQQEDDNGILLQLLKAKVSTDESTGIRILDCDKGVFRQEGGCVIARDGDRLHMCLTLGKKVEVPNVVRSIAFGAFHYELCPNVKHIIFPKSVEALSGYAIASETVEEVTIHNVEAYISDYAFSWCRSLRAVHYPSQNKTIYLGHEPKRHVYHVEDVMENGQTRTCHFDMISI